MAENTDQIAIRKKPMVPSIEPRANPVSSSRRITRHHPDSVTSPTASARITRVEAWLPELPPQVDGLLGVFHAPGDKWSFARADSTGRVLETAEKSRISDWASTGLYYFRRGRDFVAHAEAMIGAGERVNGEFYVAPACYQPVAEGKKITVCRLGGEFDTIHGFGTPEDLGILFKNTAYCRDRPAGQVRPPPR